MTDGRLDYRTEDSLVISVRKDKEWSIRQKYKKFGWVQYRMTDDSVYENIAHIYFKRPHDIAHKDELQLLQVNMETAVNRLSKAERYKNYKSMALGTAIALISSLSLLIAVLLPLLSFAVHHLVACGIFALLAILTLAIGIPVNAKRREREQTAYDKLTLQLNAEIDGILKRAEQLIGVNDEEKLS